MIIDFLLNEARGLKNNFSMMDNNKIIMHMHLQKEKKLRKSL